MPYDMKRGAPPMRGGQMMRGPGPMDQMDDEPEDAETAGRDQALDEILQHVNGLIGSKFSKPKVEIEVSEDNGQDDDAGGGHPDEAADEELFRRLMAESGR